MFGVHFQYLEKYVTSIDKKSETEVDLKLLRYTLMNWDQLAESSPGIAAKFWV